MNYCYARPRGFLNQELAVKRQFQACEILAKLHGLPLKQDEGGGGYLEAQSVSDTHVRDGLIKRLGPNDTLLIASPDVLADKPAELLAVSAKVVASGCRLLVASLGGEIQLPLLREYVAPWTSLEDQLAEKDRKIAKLAKEHEAEFELFCKEYDHRVMAAIASRGISLSMLATGTDAKDSISSPSKARQVREIRQNLGLSQEDAGALPVKWLDVAQPLTKAAISKLETNGSGAHYAEYLAALQAEQYAQTKLAKKAIAEASPYDIAMVHDAHLPTPNEERTAKAAKE